MAALLVRIGHRDDLNPGQPHEGHVQAMPVVATPGVSDDASAVRAGIVLLQ